MKNIFIRIFICELIVIAGVVTSFRLIPERLIAGSVAGTLFVLLGVGILLAGRTKTMLRNSATYWAAAGHLFLSALPLMITRMLNSAGAFADIRVLGLPGPVFHQVSTGIFLVLIAATVFDAARMYRIRKRE